ncbi:MAG: MurR/RpiR family transcriptional regulator [Devosia sp.]|nr:MurR/RpiR family transcriptional regulator [Devosia sp.]
MREPALSPTSPILDYEAFCTVLAGRQNTLSKRLQQVARFFLNHPEEVAVSTLVTLADHAQVPPATITRFAKELGFAGFAELQAVFRERLMGPRAPYAERVSKLRTGTTAAGVADADLNDPGRVFEGFVHAAVNSLVRIEESLDREELAAFVDAMVACDVVHVAAARGAFSIGAYSVFGLANVGKRAHLVDNLGAMRAQQVGAMGPRDVLLAVTFDDYTPETLEAARLAANRGLTVLAITDNELSPVVPLASHVLYVTEARLGHFRSQVPALVVCQAVIVSLGRRLGEQVAPDKMKRQNQKSKSEN